MYLQKEISIKIFFVGVLKVIDEKRRIRIRIQSRSRMRWSTVRIRGPGSATGPYQNATDPEYCIRHIEI